MKRTLQFCTLLILFTFIFCYSAFAQRGTTITGTAVIYGSGFNTRTVTRPFTLTVNSRTSDRETASYLDTLQVRGQDALMQQMGTRSLGRFSFTGSVAEPLNAVFVEQIGGDTLIRAVFRHWVGFGEIRRGLRSVDYPFSYVEVRIDPRTKRGEGVIYPAAKLRFRGENTIEIEDFGTLPGRLIGVRAQNVSSF